MNIISNAMSPSSGPYFIFLIAVFFAYWSVAGRDQWKMGRMMVLAAAGYFFYAQMGWRAIALLAAVTTIDYFVSREIAALNSIASGNERALAAAAIPPARYRSRYCFERRAALALSLSSSLGALAVLKYADFFLASTSGVWQVFGWSAAPLGWMAPVGMSFFVFQSAAYVIDVYRRDTAPARSFGEYLTYLSFFPTITAGPIPRAGQLLPQLQNAPQPLAERGGRALFLIGLGLIKKIAIADALGANLVDRVFDFPERFSALEVAVGVYGYALQIYADFSGYTDIAIGSALLLGIELPANFDAPYRARTLAEFWRRWHISLSTWLRDYVFFPLAGARARSRSRLYFGLLMTMLIGGLWHGAAWTFVVWGALHGVGLCIERMLEERRRRSGTKTTSRLMNGRLEIFLTFHFICLTWIFFRAETIAGAAAVLRQLTTFTLETANLNPAVVVVIVAGYACHFLPDRMIEKTREGFVRLPAMAQGLALFALAAGLYYVGSSDVAPFIYSRF